MIFLSYSWNDSAVARTLDLWLRRRGFDVWIDFRNLDCSSEITSQLDAAINDCSMFVVLGTSQSKCSQWMRTEFLMACKHAKPIFQIAVRPNKRWAPAENR